jgi:hypothetical protein
VVARHEIADLRATSVTRKMRQLEALFASRALFPEGPDDGREAEIVSELGDFRQWDQPIS